MRRPVNAEDPDQVRIIAAAMPAGGLSVAVAQRVLLDLIDYLEKPTPAYWVDDVDHITIWYRPYSDMTPRRIGTGMDQGWASSIVDMLNRNGKPDA